MMLRLQELPNELVSMTQDKDKDVVQVLMMTLTEQHFRRWTYLMLQETKSR